jgi:hypothetical protein
MLKLSNARNISRLFHPSMHFPAFYQKRTISGVIVSTATAVVTRKIVDKLSDKIAENAAETTLGVAKAVVDKVTSTSESQPNENQNPSINSPRMVNNSGATHECDSNSPVQAKEMQPRNS